MAPLFLELTDTLQEGTPIKMSGLTLSCPVSALGSLVNNNKDVYGNIYKELVKVVKEDEIVGIQLYPAGWPRKLQITVANKDLKNTLLVEGLDIFGLHVDFRDEDNIVTKVIIKDAPMEWSKEFMIEIMGKYGEIVRVEREMVYVEGRRTSWTTGTWYTYVSKVYNSIPNKLEVKIDIKSFILTAWYRGQGDTQEEVKSCSRCGSSGHNIKTCPHAGRVCFTCKGSDHANKDCPQNDGTRKSEEAMVFFSAKCPLNNRNTEYPFRIEGTEYSCVDQYAVEQKCLLFGDSQAAKQVMEETDPRNMKKIGDDLKSYDHRQWMDSCKRVVHKAVLAKFTDTQAAGATAYLMDTKDLVIGEATRHTKWGTGLHVSDQNALQVQEWSGENWMGGILMDVRSKIQANLAKLKGPEPDNEMEGINDDGDREHNSFLSELGKMGDTETDTQPKQWALVIGDSNIVGLTFDDDNVPLRVLPCAKGGTKLDDVSERVNNCLLEPNKVDIVAMHVGTCEWNIQTDVRNGDSVFAAYVEVLNTVSSKYPHAELVVSGVPLRKPSGLLSSDKCEAINQEVMKLNTKLQTLATQEDNVYFIDHTEGLYIDENKENLYRDSVHLNEKGRMILSANIRNGIREGYAKSMLQLGLEWQAANSSS